MDLSDPDSLLRRVRWPNVGRLAALVVLAVLAALLPRLSSGSPAVPTGVAVPVLSVAHRAPVVTKAPAKDVPKPKSRPVHHNRAHHLHPPKPKHHVRRPRTPAAPRAVVPRPPTPVLQPAQPSDSTTEFNPAAREFGG